MNNAEFFIGNRKVSGKAWLICFLLVVSLSAVGHKLLSYLEDCLAGMISERVANL